MNECMNEEVAHAAGAAVSWRIKWVMLSKNTSEVTLSSGPYDRRNKIVDKRCWKHW
jgi:hypothetical protein